LENYIEANDGVGIHVVLSKGQNTCLMGN